MSALFGTINSTLLNFIQLHLFMPFFSVHNMMCSARLFSQDQSTPKISGNSIVHKKHTQNDAEPSSRHTNQPSQKGKQIRSNSFISAVEVEANAHTAYLSTLSSLAASTPQNQKSRRLRSSNKWVILCKKKKQMMMMMRSSLSAPPPQRYLMNGHCLLLISLVLTNYCMAPVSAADGSSTSTTLHDMVMVVAGEETSYGMIHSNERKDGRLPMMATTRSLQKDEKPVSFVRHSTLVWVLI